MPPSSDTKSPNNLFLKQPFGDLEKWIYEPVGRLGMWIWRYSSSFADFA